MICTKCKKTVRVVTKFLDDKLNMSLVIAQAITSEVSKVIDNPLFELLASQLPARFNTKVILSKIEEVLSITGEIVDCKDLTGIDKINCLMKGLNLLPKEQRNSILLRLSSALTAHIDGNRYKGYVYDTSAQFNYLVTKIEAGDNIKAGENTPVQEATKEQLTAQVEAPEELLNVVQIAEQMLAPTYATPSAEVPQEAPPSPKAF